MIKKLIPISVILALAMTVGLVGLANAAWNSVQFTANTPTGVEDLIITSGSNVDTIVIGTSTITVTLASGSNITFTSANGNIMKLDHPIATNVCNAGGDSFLTIPHSAAYPTVILRLAGTTCSVAVVPTITSVVITNSTTVTVTFSKDIDYLTDAAAFKAAVVSFGGTGIDSSSISGNVLTLTFASALTGIKDDSKLVLPAQIRDADDVTKIITAVTAVTNQVVTDLATINQLYDFVFVIQTGQNFVSVPYNVTTTLANSYVDPSPTSITIFTILDSAGGGTFSGVLSSAVFEPLDGYYINSTGSTDVYLRLKKTAAASQSLSFERTFSAVGWHIIGVASNNVSNSLGNAVANLGDAAVLSSLAGTASLISPYYDRVVDIAVGLSDDDNIGGGAAADSTYDSTDAVYKALLDDDFIVTKVKAEIDLATKGIEFNHGEAYFIYITLAPAKYIGEKVNTGNLTL